MAEQRSAGGLEGDVAGQRLKHTDEWTLAALAHASILLALVLAVAGGIGVFVGPIAALAVYLGYRSRSRFVAFQALQALVYQVIGILAYVVLVAVAVVWIVLAWLAAVLLLPVGIGLLLIPSALLLTLLTVLALLSAPLAWTGYGLYAAYEVYQGKRFRYWLAADIAARAISR